MMMTNVCNITWIYMIESVNLVNITVLDTKLYQI